MTDACGKEYAGEILKVTVEDALGEDSFGVYPIQGKKRVAITLGGYGKKGKEGRIGTLTPRVGEAVYLLGRARIEGICVRVRML